MDDLLTPHTTRARPEGDGVPAFPPAPFEDTTFAAFVGREFTAALSAGLRRATAGTAPAHTGAHRVPDHAPERTPAPEALLLRAHAPQILRRYERSLAALPALAAARHRRTRSALARWGRQLLDTACVPAAARGARPTPAGAPHRTVALPLLIDAATRCLPSEDPASLAVVRALLRAGGLPGHRDGEVGTTGRRTSG
ncbi:hypothetical protein ABZ923_28685 [Streptomyces sp. NPDC046881]|uniref:hypothetical protein n=1 Tax=Streptomyces sp. NPDC046881 TaxID=3155374 RepID=UPI0033E510A2